MLKLIRIMDYLKDPRIVASIQQFFGVEIYYKHDETFQEEKNYAYTKLDDNERNSISTCHRKNINGCEMANNKQLNAKRINPLEQGTNEPTIQHKEALTVSNKKNDPNYVITNLFWYYTFAFGTELGDELFYSTFIPFLFWNIDGAVGQRVVLVWTIIMTIGTIM